MKNQYIVGFSITLLILIFISSFSCVGVEAYSITSNYSIYEGMEEVGLHSIKKIDSFAETPGGVNCKSNLQNSQGRLCLSTQQKWLLQTRGGNASTGEAQIGN